MDNSYMPMDEFEQQPEVIEEQQKPVSPFADSPYETAFVEEPISVSAKPSKKKKCKGKRLLSGVLVFVLVAVSCGATAVGLNSYWAKKFNTLNDAVGNKLAVQQQQIDAAVHAAGSGSVGSAEGGAQSPGVVYAKNVQAVVAISNESLTTNIYGQVSKTASSGSGFIISEDGYVVSNYHVVEGASTLKVITSDSQEYEAKLVGYDATNDLAVLKIEATGLPFVSLGSSDALAVGDQVVAIGNPLGELTSTLTVGYISAKDREVSTEGSYMNMLQTDAAINSGKSGGPLFNMSGEVVGITTAKYSGTSNSGATIEGIGFAIPIDDVVGLIEDLVEHGFITGAYLGVQVRDMDAEVAQTYGFPMGVYVVEVTEGSCAQIAGVQAKDIITNIGGYDVASLSELSRALRRLEAGQSTTITVFRGGAQVHMNIVLDEKPQTPAAEETVPEPTEQSSVITPGYGYFDDWFGSFFPGLG